MFIAMKELEGMSSSLFKKSLAVAVILLFISVSVIPSTGMTVEKKSTMPILYDGNILYVGGSGPGNYTTIQAAINDADNGDTVFVYDDSSPYYENIEVDKSINLVGENRETTVIDGDKSGNVVSISADWVNISRFTIRNSSSDNEGIEISSNFNTIKGNTISDNDDGICLNSYSSNNSITGNFLSYNHNNIKLSYANSNSITGNSFRNSFGNGIQLSSSSNNKIKGNIISYNYINKGIVLYDSSNNTITGNTINSNSYECEVGILLSVSNSNIITGNTVSTSDFFGDGIQLLKSSNNTITGNNISSNKQDGIHLSSSSNNNITGNTISSNERDGVYLGSSSNNIISNNSFFNDGLRIEDSYQNTVFNNTVNGKPLIYLENEANTVINNETGEIILVNCNNITIQNQNISQTSVGIELLNTTNCLIKGNNILKSRIGIFLTDYSSDNIILGNNISSKHYGYGMVLSYSNSNILMGNNISSNSFCGLKIYCSNYNSITENIINAHDWGIYLGSGIYNIISNNTIYASSFMYGFWIDASSDNIISENTINCRLGDGLYIEADSNRNIIFQNTIVSNGHNGIYFYGIWKGCEDNEISENIISSNDENGILIYNCDKNTVIGNVINSNGEHGILVSQYSNYTVIRGNNISFNKKWGIWLNGNYHKVLNNNFIGNKHDAFFVSFNLFKNNRWAHNYWGRPRFLPHPIIGFTVGPLGRFLIPWIIFDWNPAREPYDI